MDEKNIQNQPADNGLNEVSAKMDALLEGLESSKASQEKAAKAAEDAKALAQKALDEATAAKNAHPVNFAPAKAEKSAEEKKAEKAEKSMSFKNFLNDVKAAKYGNVKAALQAGAATGSYLVPEDFLPELIDLLEKYPSYVTEARRIPWGAAGNTRVLPNLATRPSVAITGEGEDKVISNPAFGQITQKLSKLTSAVVITRELIEDAGIDLVALLPSLVVPSFVDALNTWLFSGQGVTRPGIFTASGVHTPTVANVSQLLNLKYAVPQFVRPQGKFYVSNDIYAQLASLSTLSAPKWLTYQDGVMRIDGNEVVNLDSAVIGADGRACFGNLNIGAILSPKTPSGFAVRYSDTATMVEGTGDDAIVHHLFQQNKEGWIFEARTELTILGSVWAKASLGEESAS